jgi:hypothetical protein
LLLSFDDTAQIFTRESLLHGHDEDITKTDLIHTVPSHSILSQIMDAAVVKGVEYQAPSPPLLACVARLAGELYTPRSSRNGVIAERRVLEPFQRELGSPSCFYQDTILVGAK